MDATTAETPKIAFFVTRIIELAERCERASNGYRAQADAHGVAYIGVANRLDDEAKDWRWLASHLPALMAAQQENSALRVGDRYLCAFCSVATPSFDAMQEHYSAVHKYQWKLGALRPVPSLGETPPSLPTLIASEISDAITAEACGQQMTSDEITRRAKAVADAYASAPALASLGERPDDSIGYVTCPLCDERSAVSKLQLRTLRLGEFTLGRCGHDISKGVIWALMRIDELEGELSSLRSALQEARDERDTLRKVLGGIPKLPAEPFEMGEVTIGAKSEATQQYVAALIAWSHEARGAVQRGERDT